MISIMTKYFTIATGQLTADQDKILAEHWKGYGWWHGVSCFWLLRDHTDIKSAASIRDDLRDLIPAARVFVLEIDPQTWAGSGMNEANRDWLGKYWPPEGK
jgi:hypothetical protein